MEAGTEHPHLYRFGFLATDTAGSVSQRPNERWRLETHGPLEILLHEETDVRRFDTSSGSALLLGWALPIGEGDIETVIERVIASPESGLADQLSQLSGRFCLVLQTGQEIRVVTDPFGSRTIYYAAASPGTFASHAELLATHLEARPSAQTEAFAQTEGFKRLSVKYLPGDRTMFDEVRCLMPNHVLQSGAPRPVRFWPARDRQECSLEDFFGRCDLYFESLARGLGDNRPVFLGLTGGIDTRFLLAGLARHGLDLHGMTWLGGYHDPRERPVIEEISTRMAIPNRYVEMPGPRDQIADVAGRNGGNARGASRLTSAIKAAIPDMPQAVFVRGYGGEIIRGFYNLLKQPMRDDTPEEMFRVYAHKSSAEERGAQFDAFARDAFADFADRAGYDQGLAARGYDVNDLFYWEQRMGNWAAAMHNEMDPAMFSVTGLNDRLLYDLAFGLPSGVRLKKSLFSRYIDRSEPRLSGLPII